MKAQDLREKFLKFFEKNHHVIIPSASLVPSEEEQLAGKEKVLFSSAGMQQLIPYLMGKPHPKGNKLADVQKCVRTDDIEQVGDATHHTFFEMLGNWSLGDYWKDEAIELSFKFLTEELKVPIEKLAISVFAGDKDTPKDEESANKWKDLGISEKRIAYLGKEANWWPTNPSFFGPCGPDTEMFIWTGEGPAPENFDSEDKNWVEVWNDVFMEFNRKSDGTLEELPQKNVDTGMGLERMLAVLNKKDNSYETDLFLPIIEKICTELEINYEKQRQSIRIIADHIKAAVFLIGDGVMPSNKMQGYILRRLLRRAALKAFLINKNFGRKSFKSLIESIINIYPTYFNETSQEIIEREISLEIGRFRKTLENGLKEMEKIDQIDGKIAFDLYQTYGFPVELTEELFKEKGQQIDQSQFEENLKKHQAISRSG